MTLSLSCEVADHAGCLRRSCSCYCGHPGRLSEAERDAVLAAAPKTSLRESRSAPTSLVPTSRSRRPRQTRQAPRAPVERPCRTEGCDALVVGRRLYCDPCRDQRAQTAAVERPCLGDGCPNVVTGRLRYCPTCKEARNERAGRTGPARLELPVEEMVAKYEAGAGIIAVGEAYGISSTTVRKRLMEAGVTMRPRGGASHALDLPMDELVARYEAGEGLGTLSRVYECSPMTIRKRLGAAGITIREPGRNNNAVIDLDIDGIVTAYRDDGLKLSEVAERYGVSTNTITRRLVEAGVTIRPKRWKPLPERELVASYQGGATCKELAERMGVDEGTVANHLRAAGAELRPGGPERVVLDVDEVARRYDAGESTETLAVAFGCSAQVVTRRLKAAGHELRPVGEKPNGCPKRVEVPVEEAARRYKLGWSLEDLGVEYGTSWATVRDRLRDAGVEIRGQGKRGDGVRRG